MDLDRLPLFPLATVLFPGAPLPLHIFEPRYRQMLADCLGAGGRFGVVLIREGWEAGPAEPVEVGTVARILKIDGLPDGRANLLTLGESRFRITGLDTAKPYLRGRVEPLPEPVGDEAAAPAATRRALDHLAAYAESLGAPLPPAALARLRTDPVRAAYAAATAYRGELRERQRLLEQPTAVERLDLAARLYARDLAFLRLGIPADAARVSPLSRN